MSDIVNKSERKQTIPWKLGVIFLCFSAAIIFVGISFYKSQRNRVYSEYQNNLTAIATLKIGQIQQWHKERLGDAAALRDNEPLILCIKQYFRDKNKPEIKTELTKWMKSIYTDYDYSSVLLVDTSLKVRLSLSSADTVAGDIIGKEMDEVLKNHRIIMTDLHKSETVRYVHLDLLIPLVDPESKHQSLTGILILRIDPSILLFPLIQSWPTPSKSSETLLLRREGDSIVFINELRHSKNKELNMKLSLSNKSLLASKAAMGRKGVVEGTDYRNIPVVGYLTDVPGFPWFMVAKVDKEEILLPVKKYLLLIVIVIVLLVLINASIFGFWIWDQQVRFYRKQLKNEEEIKESEEKFITAFQMSPVSVTISSMNDNKFIDVNNIFLYDMEYTREEVIGRTPRELDIWADENERLWIINEISEKGKIFGKVISYKTRTGKIIYGLSSMSVVKVNGEPCNLSTVVNITENRKAEENLKVSEELFRELFENMLNGFAYCKMIYEDGNPPDFIYINVNEAFTTLTGLKDIIGKRASEAIPGIQEDDPELFERYNRVALTGNPEVFEIYVESLKMWFSIAVYSPKKEYFVAVFDVITARKVAEIDLRASEERYRILIDQASDGIFVSDSTGKYVDVNIRGCAMLGYSRDEILAMNLRDLIPPGDLKNIPVKWDELREGKTVTNERRMIRKDGSLLYVEISARMFPDGRLQGITRDMTDRKRVEEALRESEERFRSLYENVTIGIYRTTLDGRILMANPAMVSMLGFDSFEQLAQRNLQEEGYEPDYPRSKFIETIEKEGKISGLESAWNRRSGKVLYVRESAIAVRDTTGKMLYYDGTVEDITDRKKTEEALRENEKRLREAQEMAHLGFWLWDIKTGNVEWSDEVFKIFCLDPATFTPKIDSILELSPWPDDNQRDKELISRAIESHNPGTYEQKFLRPDKSIGYYYSTFRGSYDVEGDLISIVGTILDITERKIAEEALRESEDKFKYIFDHSLIAKSITLPSGEINVNRAFCDMLGYQPEELKKINWADISHPDDIKLTNDSLNLIISGKKDSARFTKRYIHKNGSVIWAVVGTSLRRDADNKPQYFMTSVNDITERKAAEEALRESEERFSKSFRTSPISFMIANLEDGRIIEVNDAFTTISGFTREEALSSTTLNLKIWVHEQDRQHIIASLQKGKAILHEETLLRAKSGNIATVLLSAQVIKLGNRNCIISSIEDITQRKHAEEALRESEERFRSMANSMSQLVWVARADGFIYWYNQRWYEYTGTKPEQMEGWGWQIVHDPEVLPQVMKNWTASIASGQSFEMSFPLRGADGKFRTFLTRVEPWKDAEGRVVQWFGTNTNVETLKQAEERIRLLNNELDQRVIERTANLEAANKELEAFSYSVSHDLRAPLRSVHGFTKILLEDYESTLDEEGKRICGIISSSATKMGELIDDLLSFSRIGRSSLNPSEIDMKKMSRVIFEGITTPTERKRIKLKIGKLPKAYGDVTLIGQVWTNLISNAIKYTSKNEVPEINIGSKVEGKILTYFIKDNGVGFDMQYVHKLFGVFQRLHSEAEFEGNGVGLAIIQRIIFKHGGKVWAEGEVGKGATFYFSLPVEDKRQK
jgi:PAS domain S-box-containing protein